MLVAIIPALDEEGSIGPVVSALLAAEVDQVIVGDNGSTDRTAEIARAAGAHVVDAPRRGYGSACLAALAALPDSATTVVFCDADGADDLTRLADLTAPVLAGDIDLMIGSRSASTAARAALSPPQRFGNWIAGMMIRLLYRVRCSDLGPFRCIDRRALDALAMSDPAFGWTAEMQVKAYRLKLRVAEIAVDPLPRSAGISKISGNAWACVRAGYAIITTILYHRRSTIHHDSRAIQTTPC
ncbi:MAG: glycosyltransferase family 2 protein [Planctomycetota bacterium]|jgi:glycosyltransferase involved in cell wall biosynthesis